MKILLTGANGFLGKVTAQELTEHHEVIALVREIPSNKIKSIQYLLHNLCQPLTPIYSEIQSIDAIVHLAQSKLYKDFPNSAADIFNINVQSTLNLLEMGRRFNIKQFIFTSTGTVYEPFTQLSEDRPVDPQSFYGVTKFLAEKLITCYQQFFKVCSLRLFFLYGDLNNSSLITNLVHRINNNESIHIEGPEGIRFNPTHVKDVASLIHIGLQREWEGIINLASPEEVTLKKLVAKISRIVGKQPIWNVISDKVPQNITPSLSKLKFHYPEMHFTPLEKGLLDLLSTQQA